MEIPICTLCAKTGILCNACEAKLERSEITEIDIEISKIFYENDLQDISFERAIETDDYIIVLTRKEMIGKIIGRGGDNIRMLSKKLGKKVRVIGTGNLQDTIYDLIAPATIESIKKVYMPGGNIKRKIKINPKDRKKLRMDPAEIATLLSSITREQIEITIEE